MKIDILVKFCTLFSFWLQFQWVINGLGGQKSKYGLMGTSAKTGKIFFEGHRSTFCMKVSFGIGHPHHLHIKCSLYVCRMVQGSQIFKLNSIISICSKVIAFLVILLSPRGPHSPLVIHVVPTSSPHCPHHPHVIPIAPEGPHVVPMAVVSIVSTGDNVGTTGTIWTMLPSSPCHPCHPHVISTSSRRSPHHLQSPRYPSHPPLTPWGLEDPESVKML